MNSNNNDLDYSEVFKHYSRPMAIVDKDFHILETTPAFKNLFSAEQTIKLSLPNLFSITKEHLSKMSASSSLTLDDLHYQQEEKSIPIKLISKKLQSINGYLIEVIDEQSLKQTATLAGKVAHELSNIAAILRVSCDSLGIELQNKDSVPTASVKNRQERLEKAVSRFDNSIKKLKTFTAELSQWHKKHPQEEPSKLWDELSSK